MDTFKAGAMIQFGWETFKKRAWFLIGMSLVMAVIVLLIAGITAAIIVGAIVLMKSQTALAVILIVVTVACALSCMMVLGMGYTALALSAHDHLAGASYWTFWYPHPFWKFVGVRLLVGLITLAGFILLIIPGLYWMLIYLFAPFIVIEKKLGPVEALKESARITRGRRWELALLFAGIYIVNLIGYYCLFVGLFVTMPITMLAIVHAYRTLSHTATASA